MNMDEYERRKREAEAEFRRFVRRVIAAVMAAIAFIIIAWGSWYVVPEGHEAVVTRFGRAIYQSGPGLHFKTPLIDGVRKFDVRERKVVAKLNAATSNRLPITADVSVNWRIKRGSVLEIFRNYGTLAQFEDRIINPRIRQAAKAAISRFDPEVLIRERNRVIEAIKQNLIELLKGYPVMIESAQLENVVFPQAYMAAVEAKLKAFEEAQRERFNLQKQKLQAQRLVQTAEAERDAAKAKADGQAYARMKAADARAYAIRKVAEAQAQSIKMRGEYVQKYPQLIEYERVKAWNGKLPDTVLGGGQPILFGLGGQK